MKPGLVVPLCSLARLLVTNMAIIKYQSIAGPNSSETPFYEIHSNVKCFHQLIKFCSYYVKENEAISPD